MANFIKSLLRLEEEYKYAHVKVPYRSEKLDLSKSEQETLQKWIKLSKENCNSDESYQTEDYSKGNLRKQGASEWLENYLEIRSKGLDEDAGYDAGITEPIKVIFDTDIGTDVDDSLALLLLLHLPAKHVKILGITTAYGYTNIRAKAAESIVNAFLKANPDHDPIPIIVGEGVPIGTHRDVWHTGTEGAGYLSIEEIEKLKTESEQQKKNTSNAPKFIVDMVHKYPGEVVLLCLGALTNVARALQKDPKIAKMVKRAVYMGMGHRMTESQTTLFPFRGETDPIEPGSVYFYYPNHNISCDTLAAVKVFQSGMDISVVNDTVTNMLWWDRDACQHLVNSTEPAENVATAALLKVWLSYRTAIFYTKITGTCPHDPLTTAEAIYPDRFVKYVGGHLMITEWAGFSCFVLDPKGPHRIGISIQAQPFLTWFSSKLTKNAQVETSSTNNTNNNNTEEQQDMIAVTKL